jgi:hypothetical protein
VAERLPESLVSRFVVAVRDILWFREKVERFLERGGVPPAIMAEVRRAKADPTIKKCQRVVDLLEQSGESGAKVLQTLFAQISEWTDLTHLKTAEERGKAQRSQDALKVEIKAYANRRKYQERKEREQQDERAAKRNLRPLDHVKLQDFRDRFDAAAVDTQAQRRGNELEQLINDILQYYCESKGPFRREGEQVDGHFRFDGHDYFCEVRWKKEQTNAADISVLRDRAAGGFGGDVRALFVSFNGFTKECLESLNHRAGQERVILMDGVDLRAVLNSDLAFDILLAEKLACAVREQRAFVSAREIVMRRMEAN